jgi:peptidyl-dipeptidase Dcp
MADAETETSRHENDSEGVTALLSPWTGPHGGAPPFGRYTVDDLAVALDRAAEGYLAQIAAIADDPSPPTFENTFAALERADAVFGRVRAIYGVHVSTLKDEAVAALERRMAPRLAAIDDAVPQNERLFARLSAVAKAASAKLGALDAEQRRLVHVVMTRLVRNGAELGPAQKSRLGEIHQTLADRYTRFAQNLLAEETEHALVLTSEAELEGLPPALIDALAAAAEAQGEPGKWRVQNTRSSIEPFLTYAARRDLRARAWEMFVSRGDHRDARDNAATVAEILALRAERAKLLGYPTHAHWVLAPAMAKEPSRALALMESVWAPAAARVAEEVADMQAIADAEGAGVTIEPWDYRYYGEKVRRAKYDLDQNDIKPYLQLERLCEAMFWVAGKLFDLSLVEITDGSAPTYHPDVRVFAVQRKGAPIGLFYFDPFARAGKTSGAWMNEYRLQSRLDGETLPIVSNNSNFIRGKAGDPVLVSWDDARTLFHEFGHAMHGLLSSVTHPSLSGTLVTTDFVEFPSQLFEHWLGTRELLDRFARHAETGEPMPAALREKIERSETFAQGFATIEYLASAMVDMKLHLAGDRPIDPRAFEVETLAELGMPRAVVMRHRTTQFAHVFSVDHYAAGYYSYLWADTLSADAAEAFRNSEAGPYDAALGERLRRHVLSAGNTVDPAEAYRAFRGADPDPGALLRKRGFLAPSVR